MSNTLTECYECDDGLVPIVGLDGKCHPVECPRCDGTGYVIKDDQPEDDWREDR